MRLLSVLIMVKNEERVLEATLKPFIDNDIKDIGILDTGSTDNTLQVAEDLFKKYDLNGFVKQEPFIDFATSRNRLLDIANDYFSNTTFFLMIDADWYIQNVPKLISECQKYEHATDVGYLIRVRTKATEFSLPRVFRVSAQNRYIFPVHEQPENRHTQIFSEDIYFILSEENTHIRKSRARFERDLKILLKEHKKKPTHTPTLFFLAQTYECLGDERNAFKYNLKRSAFKVGSEEDYVIFLRLGYLSEHLSLVDNKYTWEMAEDFYWKAFARRSTRMEPLLAIASHYITTNPRKSYMYLSYCCKMPYPENDTMYVQRNMYFCTRYELLSSCAHLLGHYEEGKWATEKALEFAPDNVALQQRLESYRMLLKKTATNKKAKNSSFTPPIKLKNSEERVLV